jgi:hypothetical protein
MRAQIEAAAAGSPDERPQRRDGFKKFFHKLQQSSAARARNSSQQWSSELNPRSNSGKPFFSKWLQCLGLSNFLER